MKPSNPIVACQSKKAYKTKELADSTAEYLATKFIDVESYKCQFCDNYHLTSGVGHDR